MPVSEGLLKILACPKCKGEVRQNRSGSGLDCLSCRLTYPVRDDIPVMLIDEAAPLEEEGS
jgi:uncharacterized protein YbaR (Trm112 family)